MKFGVISSVGDGNIVITADTGEKIVIPCLKTELKEGDGVALEQSPDGNISIFKAPISKSKTMWSMRAPVTGPVGNDELSESEDTEKTKDYTQIGSSTIFVEDYGKGYKIGGHPAFSGYIGVNDAGVIMSSHFYNKIILDKYGTYQTADPVFQILGSKFIAGSLKLGITIEGGLNPASVLYERGNPVNVQVDDSALTMLLTTYGKKALKRANITYMEFKGHQIFHKIMSVSGDKDFAFNLNGLLNIASNQGISLLESASYIFMGLENGGSGENSIEFGDNTYTITAVYAYGQEGVYLNGKKVVVDGGDFYINTNGLNIRQGIYFNKANDGALTISNSFKLSATDEIRLNSSAITISAQEQVALSAPPFTFIVDPSGTRSF